MGVKPMRINEIVRGKRAVTADTALRLAEALGTSARFWMNLQSNYDLAIAALAYRKVARVEGHRRTTRLASLPGHVDN